MKSYSLKLSGREEGPYGEAQIAQMFADGRVNRNTPCKPGAGGDWKSIDDYLPMLKYGTQLPPPSEIRSVPPKPPATMVHAQATKQPDVRPSFWPNVG
jgi:hypothetical protein